MKFSSRYINISNTFSFISASLCSVNSGIQTARRRRYLSMQFEYHQHGGNLVRRQSTAFHQGIDGGRFVILYAGAGSQIPGNPRLLPSPTAGGWQRVFFPCRQGSQLFKYIMSGFHQFSPLAEQGMATACQGIVDGAGDGEDFPSLLRRQPRGDKRTALHGGLHNQGAKTEGADQAIAAGKIFGAGRRAGRKFRDQRAAR